MLSVVRVQDHGCHYFPAQMLAAQKLAWTTDYAVEKFLPLLSRWHLLHDQSGSTLNLECIIKKRILRGVPSYEVKWTDFDHTTVEPMSYLKLKYSKELCEFGATRTAKKGRLFLLHDGILVFSFFAIL